MTGAAEKAVTIGVQFENALAFLQGSVAGHVGRFAPLGVPRIGRALIGIWVPPPTPHARFSVWSRAATTVGATSTTTTSTATAVSPFLLSHSSPEGPRRYDALAD